MQTRIQLTIFEEDVDKLSDRQQMVEEALAELPFPVVIDIFRDELCTKQEH